MTESKLPARVIRSMITGASVRRPALMVNCHPSVWTANGRKVRNRSEDFRGLRLVITVLHNE